MVLRLLISGIFFFAVSFPVVAQSPTSTPTDDDLIAECAQLLAPDRPISTAPDAPTIQILTPTEGTIYGSAIMVNIQSNNFDVTQEGRHWHLWVNGELMGMVYQPTAIIDLEPGDYTLCASLGTTEHTDIGMPAAVRITVERALAGTPTAALTVDRALAQVQAVGTISTGQIVILVVGGIAAAVGGWWLGTKMPKGRK